MSVVRYMKWSECLSHKIWPKVLKGWEDPDRFFWGLADNITEELKDIRKKAQDYWYIDVGYLGDQIQRYPEPAIVNPKTTYFRITKNGFHTNFSDPDNRRGFYTERIKKFNIELKPPKEDGDYILLCPSSPTVTKFVTGYDYQQWIDEATKQIKLHTDRPIKLREKPRPNNKFWNTDIKDDLKNAHCLVTSMSLSSIDAILEGVPVICHKENVASYVSSQDIDKINDPYFPPETRLYYWLQQMSNHQFTLEEIENGFARDYLKGSKWSEIKL